MVGRAAGCTLAGWRSAGLLDYSSAAHCACSISNTIMIGVATFFQQCDSATSVPLTIQLWQSSMQLM